MNTRGDAGEHSLGFCMVGKGWAGGDVRLVATVRGTARSREGQGAGLGSFRGDYCPTIRSGGREPLSAGALSETHTNSDEFAPVCCNRAGRDFRATLTDPVPYDYPASGRGRYGEHNTCYGAHADGDIRFASHELHSVRDGAPTLELACIIRAWGLGLLPPYLPGREEHGGYTALARLVAS